MAESAGGGGNLTCDSQSCGITTPSCILLPTYQGCTSPPSRTIGTTQGHGSTTSETKKSNERFKKSRKHNDGQVWHPCSGDECREDIRETSRDASRTVSTRIERPHSISDETNNGLDLGQQCNHYQTPLGNEAGDLGQQQALSCVPKINHTSYRVNPKGSNVLCPSNRGPQVHTGLSSSLSGRVLVPSRANTAAFHSPPKWFCSLEMGS
ncbi:hypothetical protein IQ06DRAFT_299249 [Phaeosphaeriaceae sp. SRC1lsM3a]|nr:hypothetical protein IQ06DRAFT_299249 [Stagonospora sp. SRC1lsM3a]